MFRDSITPVDTTINPEDAKIFFWGGGGGGGGEYLKNTPFGCFGVILFG